jgi:hypothetical protein
MQGDNLWGAQMDPIGADLCADEAYLGWLTESWHNTTTKKHVRMKMQTGMGVWIIYAWCLRLGVLVPGIRELATAGAT